MKIDAKTKLMEAVKPVKHKVKFTDRFIKIPIKVVTTFSHDTTMFIDPICIDGFFKDAEGDVAIYLRNGSHVTAYVSIEEFESILNEWYNK